MASSVRSQRGGFAVGMVVGLLIGLALALGVALYVTKVPIPFVDKVPQRTTEQDAAEAEKNKHWDPNAPLATKSPDAASAAAPVVSAPAIIPPPPAAPAPVVPPKAPASATAVAPQSPASAASAAAGMQFFVQVGAYARSEDAEQQRAKLGLSGLVGRISEREQAGKLVYRVRLGPFDVRDDAEDVRQQAAGAGFPDATLVRVPR